MVVFPFSSSPTSTCLIPFPSKTGTSRTKSSLSGSVKEMVKVMDLLSMEGSALMLRMPFPSCPVIPLGMTKVTGSKSSSTKRMVTMVFPLLSS